MRTDNRKLFTPTSELLRYLKKKFPRDIKFILLWFFAALILSVAVPCGQSNNLFNYLTYHIAMMGFGATVFGFTILGGKDDFFEPIIRENREGINSLRDMVLFLFVPLVLHMIAAAIVLVRIVFPIIVNYEWAGYVFRLCYCFVAIWATAQTFFSYRFLFMLAITRLVWKYDQIYHVKEKQEVPK